MTACGKSENFSNVLDTNDLDSKSSEELLSEFYSPLCKSGYLTPLQRKKLREKRSLDLSDCRGDDFDSFKKLKMSRIPKLRKQDISSKKKRISQKKKTENVSQVHCGVAKFFTKMRNDTIKEKKFFKSPATSRLQKANFSMPLVLKKNMFTNFGKIIKDLHSGAIKESLLKESNPQQGSFECLDQVDVIPCENKNVDPCVVKIVSCDNSSSGWSEVEIASASSNIEKGKNENVLESKEEGSHFDFEWPSDEIFLQRQEKARALKRQSILKEPNMQIQNGETEKNRKSVVERVPAKFYPIFDIPSRKQKICEDAKRNEKSPPKYVKDSLTGGEQMVIDAGQKEMGPKICHTCSMIYTIGHEEDERLHSDYHDIYVTNLKFPGWKDENVIGEYCDGRVIKVCQDDKGWKLKKVEDALTVANRDLGFSTAAFPTKPDVIFILFISNEKRVAGCIVAEPISSASRVLLADGLKSLDDSERKVWRIGNWYSSFESVPAVCGINRIWVSMEFRRRKLASRMVDCLRCHFVHGHVVSIRELAFTDPSPDGREFAAAYTGTDHFLVYK